MLLNLKTLLVLLFYPVLCYSQTKTQIENLKTFSKVYGYVKYFHPSDEASLVDWNRFAIVGASLVEKCKTKDELIKTLEYLFYPIAPSMKFHNSNDSILFDFQNLKPKNLKKNKLIYWQHQGVSFNMFYHGNTYKSIRVNRKGYINKGGMNSYCFLTKKLNTSQYKTKNIKLKGRLKIPSGHWGNGQLFLNLQGNIIRSKIVTGYYWEEIEISGTIPNNQEEVSFGFYMFGSGKVMIDDFHIYILENGEWIEKPIDNSSFENGNKDWYINKGKGEYNISKVKLGSYSGTYCCMIESSKLIETDGSKIFNSSPEFGSNINKSIGSGISVFIPLVLYGDKKSTFPTGNLSILDSLLNCENMEPNNLKTKLGSIIITWNVFQHFYPYFDSVKVDWGNELEKALTKCYNVASEFDFQIVLEELTSNLNDGHISVTKLPVERNFIPRVSWEYIDSQLIVSKVCTWGIGIKQGDTIASINNITPNYLYDSLYSRISGATVGWKLKQANQRTILGKENSKIEIILKNSEKFEIQRTLEYPINDICGNVNKVNFKFIEKDIIYLDLRIISMATIDSLLPILKQAKSIICDLRGYPNNSIHEFLSYLTLKDINDTWMYVPNYIYPDREKALSYLSSGWSIKSNNVHLNGKIIFLVDANSISYCESVLGYVEGYNLGILIGQPSAGTNGNINPFLLPGGYFLSWTGMKVLKHNQSPHHGVGVLPNIYVQTTINGVSQGRDEILEKAIEIARLK